MPYREILPGAPWSLKVDPVFRILNKREYLDQFFDDGTILISTLAAMKNYPEELRRDVSEGSGTLATVDEKGATHLFLYDTGVNAYVLCTTAHLGEQVIHDFSGVGAIRIDDSSRFGTVIAHYLPRIEEGVEGHCDYVDHRQNWFVRGSVEAEILSKASEDEYANLKSSLHRLSPGTELFRKPMKYAHQREYRFGWFSSLPVQGALVIKCPQAIQFCTRVDF